MPFSLLYGVTATWGDFFVNSRFVGTWHSLLDIHSLRRGVLAFAVDWGRPLKAFSEMGFAHHPRIWTHSFVLDQNAFTEGTLPFYKDGGVKSIGQILVSEESIELTT
jgi:hypothetical protein